MNIKELINYHDSWNDFYNNPKVKDLVEEIIGKYNQNIKTDNKKDGYYVFPSKLEDIFRFSKTDATKIQAVIVGMEPYPSFILEDDIVIPEATGRSFDVRSLSDKDISSKFKQASLRNIMKCIYTLETGDSDTDIHHIREEIEKGNYNPLKFKEWFDRCENNGVLFLNASLMYWFRELDIKNKTGKGRVDLDIPWNEFMMELSTYLLSVNPYIKWMLFGADAQKQFSYIEDRNKILAVHPRLQKFVKKNPFKEVKELFVR